GRVALHLSGIVVLDEALLAVIGIAVERPHLIPPARRIIARDAAGVRGIAIGIDMPVIGRDTAEMRRVLRRHEPLRAREVALADAADLAVRPALRRDPFDDLVEIALLALALIAILAARAAGTAHIHVDVGVALFEIPADRSRLAPQEQRNGRRHIVVETIRRRGKERRETLLARRQKESGGDFHAVAHRDRDEPCWGYRLFTRQRHAYEPP